MIPGSFVHVTCTRSESSSDIYLTCTCEIYDLIQRAAQQETPISTGEYVIPNENLTCMHCHYYREHLLGAYEKVTQEAPGKLSRALLMVKDLSSTSMIQYNWLGMLLIMEQPNSQYGVVKTVSIINLSFINQTCQVKCTEGMCAVNF